MAYNVYLSIPSLERDGFPKKSEVHSYHWGHSQSGSLKMNDFSVVRNTDEQSPLLFAACAHGTNLSDMKIFVTKGTDKTIETVVTYTFESCYISSIRPAGGGGDNIPLEEVSVNFEKSKYEQKKD